MSILLTDIDPVVAYPSINITVPVNKMCQLPPTNFLSSVCQSLVQNPHIINYFTDILIVAVKVNQEGMKLSGSQY